MTSAETGAALGADAIEDEPVLADSLRVLTVGPILTDATKTHFYETVGVRLEITEAADNDEAINRFDSAEVFDVVIADSHSLRSLYRRGKVADLDHDLLPNLRNLESRFRYLEDDPGTEFSIPIEWRLLGYGYHVADFPGPPATWSYLFDSRYRRRLNGRLSSLGSMRESMGIALLYLGHSPNTTDPEAHAQAHDLLVAAKPFLFGLESENLSGKLAEGDLLLGQGWAPSFRDLIDADPAFGFSVPDEGTVIGVTAIAVGAISDHQRTATALVDFLLRGDVAAQQANARGVASCNAMARAAIEPALLEEIAAQVPRDRPLIVLEDLGADAEAGMKALWQELIDA